MKRALVISLFLVAGAYGVARAEDPGAAEVRCKDGTTSLAGKGACSHHGGVLREDAPAKAGPATSDAAEHKRAGGGTAPVVRCKDGTTSSPGRGACSHHGGVSRPAPEELNNTRAAEPSNGRSPKEQLDTPSTGTSTRAEGRSEPDGYRSKEDLKTPSSSRPTPTANSPTARCKDGTMSYAKHHGGACSNHGGVAEWLDGTQR